MTHEITNIDLSQQEPEEVLAMNPKKFLMWLFIVTIIMLFAAFTSAYLVRRAEGNWTEFALPDMFKYSTVVLILSSISMYWASFSVKKDNFITAKIAISITFVLGMAFLVMQFLGWGQLVDINVHFVGNPSGSFVYVLSGLHGLHIVSALVVLIVALWSVFRQKIHSQNTNQMDICVTYWHFLDLLWLYLYGFMIYFG
jgi:cytochrome c oxidase subunit III